MNDDIHERIASADDLQLMLIDYIKEHFGEMLGEHAALLDRPGGLDALQLLLHKGEVGR